MPPKTTTERVSALRQRRQSSGLVRVEIYAHKEDAPKIRQYAKLLAEIRGIDKNK